MGILTNLTAMFPSIFLIIASFSAVHSLYYPAVHDSCGVNEEFKECGTACPGTCQNGGGVQPCQKLCVTGCFCKQGFILDEQSEKCVLKKDCPAEGPTQVGEGESCNLSLSPPHQTICKEGLDCVFPIPPMKGASGVCRRPAPEEPSYKVKEKGYGTYL